MNLNRMLAPDSKRKLIDLLRDYNLSRFVICPNLWEDYSAPTPPLEWKRVKFDQAGVKSLPNDKPGLYSFVVHPEIANHDAVSYLLYIGETTKQTIQKRCRDYLGEDKKKKPREHIRDMVKLWPNHLWIYYSEVADPKTILKLEEDLITAFTPPFNFKYTATLGKAGTLKAVLYSVLTK
jgi:hypothetical protein